MNAFTIKYKRTIDEYRSLLALGLRKVALPEMNYSQLNKYTFPFYYHLTIEITHTFSGFLEGASTRVLIIHKLDMDKNRLEPLENKINLVDMWNFSLVVDYQFLNKNIHGTTY